MASTVSHKVVETITTVSTTTSTVVLDGTNAETLIAELNRQKKAIKALEAEKEATTEAIYNLLGWEKIKVGDKTKWVGTANAGTIAGAERITISERNREEIDRLKLATDFPTIFAEVAYNNPYTVVIAK